MVLKIQLAHKLPKKLAKISPIDFMLLNLLPALVLEAIDEAAVAIDHGLEQKICRVAQIRNIINFRGSGSVPHLILVTTEKI